MATFFQLKNKALKTIEGAYKLANELGYEAVAQNIEEILKNFRNKQLMVVAAGEARRGKSTMLNAVLNEKAPLFPVDVNVCTNVVTVVRYGAVEKIQAYLEDGKAETITRDQIENYVSEKGNPNNYKNVKLLDIEIPNELLKEGVVFVDTPGVGSLNISHAQATYSFLPNADLLIFVSDANSGFTESELNFLKKGYQYCKNIIFPVTKMDQNAGYPVIVEDNREKIRKTIDIPEDEIEIIPISSTAKLRYLEKGSKAMYLTSNYKKFEDTMWSMIAKKRAELLILPFVAQAKEEMLKIQDSLAAQYQLLDADRMQAEEMVNALNSEVKKLERLQQEGAQWRSQLNCFCTLQNSQASVKAQNIGTDARSYLDSQVIEMGTKICKEQGYTEVIGEINNRISCGLIEIRDEISDNVDKEINEIYTSLELDLDVNKTALEKIGFQPDGIPEISFPKRKTSDKIVSKGRKIGVNSMGGGAIGGILGAIAGACIGGPLGLEVGKYIGAALGSALGTLKGGLEAMGTYDEVEVGFVNRTISQYISTSIANVNLNLGEAITQLRIGLTTEFEKMLKVRVREIQENIERIRSNLKISSSDIPGRQRELEGQAAALKAWMDMEADVEQQGLSFKDNAAHTEGSKETVKGGGYEDEKPQADKKRNAEEKPEYGFL